MYDMANIIINLMGYDRKKRENYTAVRNDVIHQLQQRFPNVDFSRVRHQVVSAMRQRGGM